MIINRRAVLSGAASSVGCLAIGSQIGMANAQEYQILDTPIDGGRVHGTLRYAGPPVVPTQIRVTKDSSICNDGLRTLQPLTVADDGALSDAVIEIKGVSGGKPWEPVYEEAKIYQIDCSFQPYVQIIRNTGMAEIINVDPLLHNIHAYEVYEGTRRSMFNFSQPKLGQVDRVPLRLRRGNLVELNCHAHNWMAGWIYTAPTPYFAITSINGRFEIPDIPPGQYELSIWHPVVGSQTASVIVRAGDDLEINLALT